MDVFSIDQNCHPLWDVIPKLHTLSRHGFGATHFVEDIDVAFTALGAGVSSGGLRLAREQYHHSGGADWGAALFYMEFLGRLPVDLAEWQAITGLRPSTMARQLGCTMGELFAEFSPSDNWQLIGPSYAGDERHHRIVGDLTVAETAPFLREILRKGKEDMFRAFPEAAARQRLQAWFQREERRLEDLLREHASGRLVELYQAWMRAWLPETVRLDLTSSLFALDSTRPARLLPLFVSHYDRAAALYNEAIAESGGRLHPLRTDEGELPYFAIGEYHGHLARTPVFLRAEGLLVDDKVFAFAGNGPLPVEGLRAAGIRALGGKAIVLALEARLGENARPLALPYRGSLYMPASVRLAEKLAAAQLLPVPLHPILRVRLHLLDRLKTLDTIIRLPDHLAASFGKAEVPAREVSANYADLAAQAAKRLAGFRDPHFRARWEKETFPELHASLAAVEERRRARAAAGAPRPELKALWDQAKALRADLFARMVRQIATDYQLRDLDYCDSRGALLPWCIALGGERFYEEVIAGAEIYEEATPRA